MSVVCFQFEVQIAKADTYNQIPLWINIMEGAEFTNDQKDQIEKEMDDIFAAAGLNWRVTSVVLSENSTDPDKSNDEPGDVRVGPEEDGLYRKGSKEVQNLAGVKMQVVRRILNETGGDSGFVGGAEVVPGTRTIVVATNRSDGSSMDSATWSHELGHVLGLGHTYANGTARPKGDLMYPYSDSGTNITAEDVAKMNQTKIERELGLPKLTDDQMGRNYDEYFSEAEDFLGDSAYGYTDIMNGYFSFFILDETRDLYVTTSLAELIPLGAGFTFSVAMDADNDPSTGGEFHGWLGMDYIVLVNAVMPDMVNGMLFKYPEMIPLGPVESRIDTRFRHRCSVVGWPAPPSIPVQNTIVIRLGLSELGPLSPSVIVGMHMQSADGLGTDQFGPMPLLTIPPMRPTLEFDPPVAHRGALVSASGSGFAPSNSVSLIFAHLNLSTVTVEPDGTFFTTFTVPNLPINHYMADAIDDSHNVGVGVFTITLPPWDINKDGKCDMKDIAFVARLFGQTVPPAPPECDIAPTPPDGKIDMRDISLAARHFGEAY
jgi:hypothetical protein